MAFKLKIYGTQSIVPGDASAHLESVQPALKTEEYLVGPLRSGGEAKEIEIDDNTVVSLQMSNDVEWHYRPDEFEALLKSQPGTQRGKDNELVLPSFIIADDTRGGAEIITTKALKTITGLVAAGAAKLLADKMEKTLILGLHSCSKDFQLSPFDKKNVVAGKPYLLLIHGTNSNILGAFKGLKNNDAVKALFDAYENRVLAFEHKTLSESPVKNLIDLLAFLPDNITLDVVSHSRGGIVADLLARCSEGEMPFNEKEMELMKDNEDFAALSEEAEQAIKAATGKNISIRKTVRVACPAGGTVLIDTRLDNMVNVLCNLLKLIPGAAGFMPFTLFLDFAKAVVHERTDIKVFPGLAAQIPGSPLVRILNNPEREIKSELFVISGDVESSGIWKTLLVMSTNLYFGEAHDYVVNSNSMFKGTYRNSIVREHFEQESNVNHFNYFENKKSQEALLAALVNFSKIDTCYEKLGKSSEITKSHSRGNTGVKPLLYILPGIMGSQLKVDKELVWADFFKIFKGNLSELKIANAKVALDEIHGKTYNDLINFFSTEFDVVPFPYDWRLSLTKAGELLAKDIDKELKNEKRTVKEMHFIAHSMGGLVLRSMIHSKNSPWEKVVKEYKPKVIMMGVPNEGSYGTIRIFLGKDSIIKKLALLDFGNNKESLLKVFSEYPGLCQLLPGRHPGIFDEKTWSKLQKANGSDFTGIPPLEALAEAAGFYEKISNTNYDNTIFRYVAGHDDLTPDGFSIDNNLVGFTGTPEGDGRVLWSTIPSSLSLDNVYYIPADHGNIPKHYDSFEGFKELLTKGSTKLLSNAKLAVRSSGAKQKMPDSDFVTIPSKIEFDDIVISNKTKKRKPIDNQIINVSVINGNLVHSNYPVVVGHFANDGIVKAEKYLNQALNYKLDEYYLAGNYPGPIGTHFIYLSSLAENNTCSGAVVVGLGDFGALTENSLTLSLKQAFLTLAIKHNEKQKTLCETETRPFGISSLLVGSDFAGLSITSSVKSIFNAVLQANEKLDTLNDKIYYQKISHVEIVEIYQHKAIQVGRIVNRFMKEKQFRRFRFLPATIIAGSGFLKTLPDDTQQDNWHRIEVTVVKNDDNRKSANEKTRPIRFASITDKAANAVELLPTNRKLVDTLIEKIAKNSQWNKQISQTLYELLIPNEFKGYGSNLHNMVMIVDKDTAQYPWELLHDANGISDKPMVVNMGMVRQLNTSDYRKAIKMNTKNRALVIGNPQTEDKYPKLPGATKEAESVAKIIIAQGIDTVALIEKTDIEIIPNLLTQSYKIIHIASHGIVAENEGDDTGLVLGPDTVFRPGDFDQMPVVPEFVFINCCSSNKSDNVNEKMQLKYKLAASVGTQLIDMGVKAAIVTGWEIDDAAANAFAGYFYDFMFQGYAFGDAVRKARENTYENYRSNNTWGAYQCYGDPFFTLTKSRPPVSDEMKFVDPLEVIYQLDNLTSEIKSSKRKDDDDYEAILNNIRKSMDAEWMYNPRITEGFAECYKEFSQFEKASMYYNDLIALEDASYTVMAMEQWNNIQCRQAKRDFDNKTKNLPVDDGKRTKEELAKTAAEADKIKKDAVHIIEVSVAKLKNLPGETSERYNLTAGCYRRLFEIDNDVSHLKNAAEFYKKSYEQYLKTMGTVYYYPYFNCIHLSILLSEKMPSNLSELNDKALNNATERDMKKPAFWNKLANTSKYLSEFLLSDKTKDLQKHIKDIEEKFDHAWRKDGSLSMKDSFANYLKFLVTALGTVSKTVKLQDQKIKILSGLAESIVSRK